MTDTLKGIPLTMKARFTAQRDLIRTIHDQCAELLDIRYTPYTSNELAERARREAQAKVNRDPDRSGYCEDNEVYARLSKLENTKLPNIEADIKELTDGVEHIDAALRKVEDTAVALEAEDKALYRMHDRAFERIAKLEARVDTDLPDHGMALDQHTVRLDNLEQIHSSNLNMDACITALTQRVTKLEAGK